MEPLGRYFAEFDTLEFSLVIMFSHLLGNDNDQHDTAMAIFKRINNISTRIQILQDVVRARKMSKDVIEAIDAICEQCVSANARRNVYAHGVYECADDGRVRLKTFVMSAQRKQATEFASVKQLEHDIKIVQAILVLALVWVGKVPFDAIKPSIETLRRKT